jgi:ribonuclease VapC
MTVVLDASAVLAVLQQERGSEAVVPLLSGACICAVNYAEVVTKLVDKTVVLSDALAAIAKLGVNVFDFDAPLAASAGPLRSGNERTRHFAR